ncbi:MAG: PAS domain-containing protein [Methanomicrobiaceae archaeon]|nr:PAS domain-containing protein [Methanomicrobiaceae archaeon]
MAIINKVNGKKFTNNINDTDIVKIFIIASFLLLSTLITFFVFSEYGQDINSSFLFLFPQLYYIPIILLSIWYPKKSIQATILMIAGFLAIITYYYSIGIRIDPFIAGLNAAIYLWVVIATTQIAHNSGFINLKYLNFLKNANAGLLIINRKNHKIIEINQKIVDLSGYNREEIIGKTLTELSNLVFENNQNNPGINLITGDIKELKARLVKKSGETATVLISCRNNNSDNVIGFTVVDISKQESENISINEEKRKLLDFISSTQDLMFVLDEKGSIQKFQFINSTLEESDFEVFIGKSFSEIIENPGPSEYKAFTEEVLENGKTISFDAAIRLKGETRYFLVIFGPHNDSTGKITGIIGNLHEKEQNRKKSTQELVSEFEARRWNNFINTAAHELRTPLQPVLGYLNLLLEKPEQSGINEETIKILKKCLISVERECSIVERMLENGIINSYAVKLYLTDINLFEMINDIISISEYSSNYEILVDIPKNISIKADSDKIYQVFDGIISNAVKYNTDKKKVKISYNESETNHYIIFKDYGTGIPKNSLERIFEPFYISNSEKLSRKYGRIGLGLSIARKYINVHGGDISVDSSEGKGSTFTVSLPKEIIEIANN